MVRIFVRVLLHDPQTGEEFEVMDGISVEIAEISSFNPLLAFNPLKFNSNKEKQIFYADVKNDDLSEDKYFWVGFAKTNFSKITLKLHKINEVNEDLSPVYFPARVPYWDSGWDNDYDDNEFFTDDGVKKVSTENDPLILKIPIHRFYNIGHRGAPYHFPENTIASFNKAIELGANGIETDICLTKDKQLVIFHDPEPVKHPLQFDRTFFEDLPYEFVSPLFTNDGRKAMIRSLVDGKYRIVEEIRLNSENHFDIKNLTLEEVRKYYKYKHVRGTEHPVPAFSELLHFLSENREKINFIFFDIKNAEYENNEEQMVLEYSEIFGSELKKFQRLPENLVVCTAEKKYLEIFKQGIKNAGEERCEFAYDASGSFGALFGFKDDPLETAREMNNTVISIGSLMRPGNLDEIKAAVRDRDYNHNSKINKVIHWTLNDKAKFAESIVAGTNGILTDKPDELNRILKRLKLKIA